MAGALGRFRGLMAGADTPFSEARGSGSGADRSVRWRAAPFAAFRLSGLAFLSGDRSRTVGVEPGEALFNRGVEFLAADRLIVIGVRAAQPSHGALFTASTAPAHTFGSASSAPFAARFGS